MERLPHNLSHYPSRLVKTSFGKTCNDIQVYIRITKCKRLFKTHLCRSQFLEHRPHCRSEEPLKSAASKSCQLVDRHEDKAFYRNASCLPIFEGIMVTPSGRLPSVQNSSPGSSIEDRSRGPIVCFIRELRVT